MPGVGAPGVISRDGSSVDVAMFGPDFAVWHTTLLPALSTNPFTSEGQLLTVDTCIVLWDVEGRRIRQMGADLQRIDGDQFAASANGKLVAWLSPQANVVRLFDTATGWMIRRIPTPPIVAARYAGRHRESIPVPGTPAWRGRLRRRGSTQVCRARRRTR